MARHVTGGIRILLVLLAVSVVLFAWDDPPNALTIYLKRTCFVVGDRLFLNDVVRSAAGRTFSPDLGSIGLPYSVGRLQILPPSAVRAALKTRYAGPLILVGQDVFVLPRESAVAGRAWFDVMLLEFISSQIPAPPSRIEVEIEYSPALPPERDETLAFSMGAAVTRNGLKAGPAQVAFRGNGPRSFVSGALGVVLHAFASVAVPKQAIRGGERFRAEALVSREVDLSRCGEDLLFFDRADGSYTARAPLAADEPIALRKIERTLFVRSGDRVSITFVRKNITVGLRGRALGSGGLEEAVAVRPDGSERRFEGRVTGDKEVLIELQ